jgi:hypothetical protein
MILLCELTLEGGMQYWIQTGSLHVPLNAITQSKSLFLLSWFDFGDIARQQTIERSGEFKHMH